MVASVGSSSLRDEVIVCSSTFASLNRHRRQGLIDLDFFWKRQTETCNQILKVVADIEDAPMTWVTPSQLLKSLANEDRVRQVVVSVVNGELSAEESIVEIAELLNLDGPQARTMAQRALVEAKLRLLDLGGNEDG